MLTIFSIHDSAAESYNTPFIMPKPAQAQRTFGQMINDEQTQFAVSPADYTLFQVATFDPETGIVTPQTPESLGNGVNFKKEI